MTHQQEREARAALALVNEERSVHGLPPCSLDDLTDSDRVLYLRRAHVALMAAERPVADAPASTQGWRWVPVEPTSAMLADGNGKLKATEDFARGWDRLQEVWSAMLAAASRPAPEHVTGAAGDGPSDLERWRRSVAHLSGIDRQRAINARFGGTSDADE